MTARILGKGGHAAVYVAIHNKTNRQLACKILDHKILPLDHPKQYLLEDDSDEQDRAEVDDLSSHNASPRIIRTYDSLRKQSRRRSNQFREFDILKDLDHVRLSQLNCFKPC